MIHTCRSPRTPTFRLYLALTLARVGTYEVSKPDGMHGQESKNMQLLGSSTLLFCLSSFNMGL